MTKIEGIATIKQLKTFAIFPISVNDKSNLLESNNNLQENWKSQLGLN